MAQEDLRPEVKMGITHYYISISSLVLEPKAEMQVRKPWGPSSGGEWLGGQQAVSPQPQGLLCTPSSMAAAPP